MTSFPTLADYLAPLPLPAIIAVLMTLGLKYLGRFLSPILPAETPQPLKGAAAFVLTAAGVAAAVHFLALAGLAYLWLLRIMAGALMVCGLLELARWDRQKLAHTGRELQEFFQEQAFWGKTALVLVGITLLGLGLAALGPPTDADSLDYHLGVPLDVLRHHGAYPRYDWLHARLTGLGESLNILGLAGGTDILGACLQFAGLATALAAILSLAPTGRDKLLLAMTVVGCPVMVFLVPNQKPQMLPIAATTVALLLTARRFQAIDRATLGVALGCAFFAMACKYTFMLSGGIVVLVGLAAAYRAGLLGRALIMALAAYVILVLPVHLQNYLFYGDPLSPFLERFRPQGDAAIVGFAAYLRGVSDAARSFLPFPVNLVLPSSLGSITTVLGLGTLLLWLAVRELRESSASRVLVGSALVAAAGTLAFGQVSARFFLEPYLWVVAAAAAAAWRPPKPLFFKIMVGQMVVMAVVAGVGAALLFPGAWTTAWRDKVMTRSAHYYAATRWLKEILPPEAVALVGINSGALMPRPFVSSEYLNLANIDEPQARQQIISMLAAVKVNTMVIKSSTSSGANQILVLCPNQQVAGPKEFRFAYRNPWNLGPATMLTVFHFTTEPWGCLK
jgi:hypothetical protein